MLTIKFFDPHRKALKALTQNHISFIIMPDSAQGSNKHLRIGGQDQVITYNRESDDAVLPDLSSQGITDLPPYKFEYYLFVSQVSLPPSLFLPVLGNALNTIRAPTVPSRLGLIVKSFLA